MIHLMLPDLFGEARYDFFEQGIKILNALDISLLTGRVDILQCRSEAYHVEIGHLLEEESALKSGM